MYIFVFIAFLALAGSGYYEYNILQDKVGRDDQEVLRLNQEVASLQADKKKLADQSVVLAKTLRDDRNAVAGLTAEVQAARQQLGQAASATPVTPALTNLALAPDTAAPKSMASVGNKLGLVATRDGKSYQEARLLKVEADGIIINHTAGIIKIAYNLLPDDLQKRFGFDSKAGPDLTADQVSTQEQLRRTAESASN